ncbi:uncharacterized protein LOC143841218 isoform X2 [Paroedura picta]|uniref:uncharacterized protein LOC143841218 isoform X2 n=1 Tax=Paroedura picta TaxID=143630 RepID=UPI00405609DF
MENQGVLFDAPDNTTTLEYDFSILFLWGLGLGFLYAMAIEGPFWRPCLPDQYKCGSYQEENLSVHSTVLVNEFKGTGTIYQHLCNFLSTAL